MSVLKEEELESFIKRKAPAVNGILIRGADSSAVSALGQQVLRGVVGASDPSFSTTRLDPVALKENPSRLDDEFRSLSLLGERRVILVEGVDDSHLKLLQSVLIASEIGNFLVLLADNLGKTSKLRVACEEAQKFASLVLYEEDATALAGRIRKAIAAENLIWGQGAEELFFALVGSDRSTAMQEMAKLTLYCYGHTQISESDVEAICGDAAAFGADQLIDAMLAGNFEATDRMGTNLDSDGAGLRGIFSVLLLHLSKLQNLAMDMERGLNAETAVRNAKPPIFFKRRSSVQAQLRKFELGELIAMQQMVSEAMLQTRKFPDLFEAITNRTLLSIARNARVKS